MHYKKPPTYGTLLSLLAWIRQHNLTDNRLSKALGTVVTSPTLQVPEALDMGLAPVKGTASQSLKAINTGDAAVNCTWEAGQPFSIVPNTASIEANQSFTFTCHFQPSEASVYTVLAACHADTGYTATVKVGFTVLSCMHQLVCSPPPATAYTCYWHSQQGPSSSLLSQWKVHLRFHICYCLRLPKWSACSMLPGICSVLPCNTNHSGMVQQHVRLWACLRYVASIAAQS